ncbi:PEP-CTERM sorting domain-containing protein [Uliginosibacterium sp. H3]|uniref:PEP-CTERM sorting domain-containing protein n=1 Tax=Uliginosibacterium silvisoli TaxID=3114758 RepID=A0ABU6K4D8_9RHOO|nr:PEP-CTERM sorting domain-containing protein [Uliginosibacterium sp. H3]
MKLKALVAAMAMAAGVAHATLPAYNDATQAGSLNFTLWNSTNGVSALFDLGLDSSTFSRANVGGVDLSSFSGATESLQITWNFITGTVSSTGAHDVSTLLAGVSGSWSDAWNTYKPNVAGSVYDVFAMDRDGTTPVTNHVLTTSATATPAATNSALLSADNATVGDWLNLNAAQGNHASVANGANVVDSSVVAYQGTPGAGFGTNWANRFLFAATTNTTGTLDFFAIDGNTKGSAQQATISNYYGKFAVDEAAGTLTWTTTVAAVPEASTYAMLLAGLGMIGLMARRRRAN